MSIVHEFLVSVIAFVILITIMVMVHEFGHFAVAKLCGVRVESFSVGFGPRLFGIKHGDTDYKVCLLLLGGYVKMTAENPGGEPPVDAPGAFSAHPRWQRMLIALAGPAANFVLAFAAMTFYFGWINEVPAYDFKTTTIEWVVSGSAAAEAGLEPGDVIRHFDTEDNPSWEKVYVRMTLDPNETVPVTVERAGKTLQLAMRMPGELNGDDLAGMLPQDLPGPIGIQEAPPGSPAAQAGLRDGDAIQSVDGHPFHAVSSLLAYMQAGQGKPLSLMVVRNGVTLGPIVARSAKLDAGWELGFTAVPIPIRRSPLPPTKALARSKQFCVDGSALIVQMLAHIATRKVSATQLAGPVGIARMAGDAAEMRGWYSKFYLAAEISLNLGIVNLLPFPMLDGWLILLLLIESALRHDMNRVVKERTYQAGLVLLMMFFAFIIFSDVTKLPIFTKIVR
jgi:regulator of sigma E protease